MKILCCEECMHIILITNKSFDVNVDNERLLFLLHRLVCSHFTKSYSRRSINSVGASRSLVLAAASTIKRRIVKWRAESAPLPLTNARARAFD